MRSLVILSPITRKSTHRCASLVDYRDDCDYRDYRDDLDYHDYLDYRDELDYLNYLDYLCITCITLSSEFLENGKLRTHGLTT